MGSTTEVRKAPTGLLIKIISLGIFSLSYLYWLSLPNSSNRNLNGANSIIISSSNEDIATMKRFSKYYQTYRYIPPASRYDFIPVPAKECGAGPHFDRWWNQSAKERSRLGEDRFMYETFFKNQSADFTGTYVELGAFDGKTESNTRFFDICLGWKGLLIEGNPVSYQKAIENRPFAHKMSFAPSCSAEYEAVNKTIPFYRFIWTNTGLVGHANAYAGTNQTVDVPCGPLSPVFEDIFADKNESKHGTIDFFSLDVEGAENLVLSTIDFQSIRINVLMIEIHNTYCKTDECLVRKQVRAKMAHEGYKRYQGIVRASDVFVHPESPFQIPESTAVPR